MPSIDELTVLDGQILSNRIGARSYMECSAETGENVEAVFEECARAALGSTKLTGLPTVMPIPCNILKQPITKQNLGEQFEGSEVLGGSETGFSRETNETISIRNKLPDTIRRSSEFRTIKKNYYYTRKETERKLSKINYASDKTRIIKYTTENLEFNLNSHFFVLNFSELNEKN